MGEFETDLSHYLETYLINTCPGELITCSNNSATLGSKLTRFNLSEDGYLKEVGKAHIPCPPLAYDSNTEEAFLLDVSKHPILCGIKPSFLVHKFENVISPQHQNELLRCWTDFSLMQPTPHNTKAGSSSRSTGSGSLHLGIWRRSSNNISITKDTICDDDPMKQKKCKDLLRMVKNYVAPRIRELLEKYAKEEWAVREE